MKFLVDTNIFIKFCLRLPLSKRIESTLLDETTERYLSPISVLELYRHYQKSSVPDDPNTWLDLALPSWTILHVTVPIARLSVLLPWQHKDPADRLLAATAQHHGIPLWHTDTTLRDLSGFPQKYFANTSVPRGA